MKSGAYTDTVTVLLVDADGRLRWRTTGPVREHSASELRAALTAGPSGGAGAAESLSIEQFEFVSGQLLVVHDYCG